MPTVVDSLVVALKLDETQFARLTKQVTADLQKTKQNANAAAKEIADSGKQAASYFGRLRTEMLALGALFVGGLGVKEFVATITTADADLGRLSRRLGISTEVLGAWQAVVERSGGTATSAAQTFVTLTQAYQEFRNTGTSPAMPYLARLGIKSMDELKDIPATLMRIGDTIEREHMNAQTAIGYMTGAGITDQATQNFLLKNRADREAQLAEATRLGVAHKKDTDAAEALEAAFLKTKQAVFDVGREIVNQLSPVIIDILNHFNAWLSKDENRKWLLDRIETMGTRIKEFLGGVNAVVTALGGWVVVSEVLLALWGGTKIAGIIAGLTRVLVLLGAIPGSGVTGALLSALNIGAIALPFIGAAGGQATPEESAIRNQRYLDERGDPAPDGSGRRVPRRAGPGPRAGEGASPGVPYAPGSVLGALGITGNQWAAFTQGVADIESKGSAGGGYGQMGGAGRQFAGRYQLGALGTHKELEETARSLFEKTPDLETFLHDPKMQERYMEAYTARHHRYLMEHSEEYRKLSPAEKLQALGYAHNQGAGGAAAWLRTHQVGRDQWGTAGTAYPAAIARRLLQVPKPAAPGGLFPSLLPGPRRPDSLTREETGGLPRGTYNVDGTFTPDPVLAPSARTSMRAVSPSSRSTVATNIGAISIHTAANDHAKGLHDRLRRFEYVSQANSGLA